jgi:hypothetical protein
VGSCVFGLCSLGLSRSSEASPIAGGTDAPEPKPSRLAASRRACQESAMSDTVATP